MSASEKTMNGYRIHRLRIVNFRGIQLFDGDIAERGVIVKGRNGAGKTSLLSAVRAALIGRDIGPDAIRIGTERAEILVDMGDLTAQRVITPSGSTLKVRNADGDTKAKPQAFLHELLGTSPLDPLDLFLEKDSKRRKAAVLAAIPIQVTSEDLQRWQAELGDDASTWSGGKALLGSEMHGLEAIALLRQKLYDDRTSVNAVLKTERAAIERGRKSLQEMGPLEAISLEAALQEQDAASKTLLDLGARGAAAVETERRAASAREKVASLRSKAAQARDAVRLEPIDATVISECHTRLAQAEEAARAADKAVRDATEQLRYAQTCFEQAERNRAEAERLEAEAIELTRTVDAMVGKAPSDEEMAEATVDLHKATTRVAAAERYAERTALVGVVDGHEAAERALSYKSGKLTTVIDRLTHEAPSELLARSNAVDGLGLDGDEITLDGVHLDALSGREQLRLATEVARRANKRAKILVVDGLERLDDEQLGLFVADATKDGFQLIATRVDNGDVVLEAIAAGE